MRRPEARGECFKSMAVSRNEYKVLAAGGELSRVFLPEAGTCPGDEGRSPAGWVKSDCLG
ncbi:hypothetical protein GCM10010471_05160 [Leucobacter komagatae]